eukprot:scaffold12262_cov121-Isochrysis_galbana.AAC.2
MPRAGTPPVPRESLGTRGTGESEPACGRAPFPLPHPPPSTHPTPVQKRGSALTVDSRDSAEVHGYLWHHVEAAAAGGSEDVPLLQVELGQLEPRVGL